MRVFIRKVPNLSVTKFRLHYPLFLNYKSCVKPQLIIGNGTQLLSSYLILPFSVNTTMKRDTCLRDPTVDED